MLDMNEILQILILIDMSKFMQLKCTRAEFGFDIDLNWALVLICVLYTTVGTAFIVHSVNF